jgi:N-acetylglucosamine-6-phosphate deacetylase
VERVAVLRNVWFDPPGAGRLGDLLVAGDRIGATGRVDAPAGAVELDLAGATLAPGLVDLQVNGFAGAEVYEATADALRTIVRELPRAGCTSAVLTMVSAPRGRYEALFDALEVIESAESAGARVLGLHLEGPYLNPAHAGAHPPEALRLPDAGEVRELLDRAGGRIKLWTIAPELRGSAAVVELLLERGVVVAAGHSALSYEEARGWFARGVSFVTHLFNAMAPFHHREPGLAGAALLDERVRFGLVADGHHLSSATVRLAAALAAPRLVLVTDAVAAAGTADGEFLVAGLPGRAEEGAVRRADGRLAGSAVTALEAVGNLAAWGGLSSAEAFDAMSRHPADVLRRPDLGRLEPGALADFLVLDGGGELCETWVGGSRVHTREAGWIAAG